MATSGVPGNGYILCWGHDPASSLGLLNVQLDADAELSGPDVADFACTLGEPCQFQVTGHDLHTTNRIIVITSGNCGDSEPVVASQTWGSAFGHAMSETIDGIASATYSLGTPVVGVPGDTYKLCWAHDPSVLSDFNVMIDSDAELIGPNVGDLLECTLGQQCAVSISGYNLADSNAIVAISSGACGDADAVVATNTWTEESPLAAQRALSASPGRNAMPGKASPDAEDSSTYYYYRWLEHEDARSLQTTDQQGEACSLARLCFGPGPHIIF